MQCPLLAIAVSYLSLSTFGFGHSYSIRVPKIEQKTLAAKTDFREHLKNALSKQARDGTQRAIAPLGGSRISPFSEIGIDNLFIVSWERPGDIAQVLHSFEKPKELTHVLDEALNAGAMNSSSVLSVPVTSQILGRLYLELGVEAVDVSHYVEKERGQTQSVDELKKLWLHGTVENDDVPLLTVYKFFWRGKARRVIFISWRVSGDSVLEREPLPVDMLTAIVPNGFDWVYLSADGIFFFSKAEKMRRADKALLSLLKPGGLALLDYPMDPYYNTPQDEGESVWMAGRSDLENFGMKKLASIAINNKVFGYCGLYKDDQVRIYQKKIGPSDNTEDLDFSSLMKVGESLHFKMRSK